MAGIDRKGDFQARVIDYSIYEAKTGSTGINLKFVVLSMWNPETEEWDDWTQYDEKFEVLGTAWIIKKDGSLNEEAAKRLAEACGPWDFESIDAKEWKPTDCSITVEQEEYNGQTRFKAAWINAFDRKPGMSGNVDAGKARELSGRFGSQLRALFGNATHAAPPTSRPKPPPAGIFPPAAKEPALNGAPGAGPLTGDKIPF